MGPPDLASKTEQYQIIGYKAKIEMPASNYPHRNSETHPSKEVLLHFLTQKVFNLLSAGPLKILA